MAGGIRHGRGRDRRAAHPTHRRPLPVSQRRPHRHAVVQYTAAGTLALVALVVMLVAQRSGTGAGATTVLVAAAEPSADRLRPETVLPAGLVEPEAPLPRPDDAASTTMTTPMTTPTTTPTTTPVTTLVTTTTTVPPDPETVATAEPTTTVAPTSTTPPDDPLERVIVTIHGDEVVRDAERELRLALAPAAVEIEATAQLSLLAASPRIAAENRNGLVDVVVIAIGGHDQQFPDGYEDLVGGTLDSLDHVGCVVWVTSEETSEGVAAVNSAIARQAALRDNALLADWADAVVPITARDAEGSLTAQARDRYGLVVGATVRECIDR